MLGRFVSGAEDGKIPVKLTSLTVVVAAVAVLATADLDGAETAAMVPGARVVGPDTSALDRTLDLYVRDGLVYYAAVKAQRSALDQFVRALGEVPQGFDGWQSDDRTALWLNAYNAIVLQTVVDHYPINGRFSDYPADSIRQIPGAFERRTHRVAGRTLTLDELETTVLPAFKDPRLFLALGRGAVDSGRLRSEVYVGARLDEQLDAVVEEFATTPRHVAIDRLGRAVRVSAIFGWREAEFVASYADQAWLESRRTPLERAILTVIEPKLYLSEQSFLAANDFALQYHEFDWRLNDLTGGRPTSR